MKKLLLLLFAGILMSACRTSKQSSTNTETKYDSIVIEKLVPFPVPGDSGIIRALLECDKNGKVVLKWFDEEHSKRMSLQFSLDSLGNLKASAKTEPDTVYLPVKNTSVKSKIAKTRIFGYPVEKKLSWWQTTLIWTGGIAWIVFVVALVFWISKKEWVGLLIGLIKKIV